VRAMAIAEGIKHLPGLREREFFIDNLLVRIHFIIVMIRLTVLVPWKFELCVQVALHQPGLQPSDMIHSRRYVPLRSYPKYSRAKSYPWSPFPPRRARPGPGRHKPCNLRRDFILFVCVMCVGARLFTTAAIMYRGTSLMRKCPPPPRTPLRP